MEYYAWAILFVLLMLWQTGCHLTYTLQLLCRSNAAAVDRLERVSRLIIYSGSGDSDLKKEAKATLDDEYRELYQQDKIFDDHLSLQDGRRSVFIMLVGIVLLILAPAYIYFF